MSDAVPPPSSALDGVLADLAALSERLETVLTDRPEADWRRATPASGWDVATQIAHLTWTDLAAVAAARAAAGDKTAWDALVLAAIDDPDGFVDRTALEGGALPPAEVLEQWRGARAGVQRALRSLAAEHPGERMPWFGPPMSPTSMATARYMETWAHGLDVHDALGLTPQHDDGVRHVCHIGVRTRDFAHRNRGLEPPAEEFAVRLVGPSGAAWAWGPDDAAQRVEGDAVEFAQLVTQRRHRDDLGLRAHGAGADRWLDLAQAFAGPPGGGRAAAAPATPVTPAAPATEEPAR